VFVPAGNYLVSSVIDIYSNTQLIGDAFGTPNGPNLISTPDFAGEAVLSTAGREYSPFASNIEITLTLQWQLFSSARSGTSILI